MWAGKSLYHVKKEQNDNEPDQPNFDLSIYDDAKIVSGSNTAFTSLKNLSLGNKKIGTNLEFSEGEPKEVLDYNKDKPGKLLDVQCPKKND